MTGQKVLAQLLLDRGADVHTRDSKGRIPLFSAANPGIANMLIEKGAEVDARDEEGNTPLLMATALTRTVNYEAADIISRSEIQYSSLLTARLEAVA